MGKYLLLKHYRGAPAAVNDVPMEKWTPQEISAHVQYMHDFAARHGFEIKSKAIEIKGRCRSCQAAAASDVVSSARQSTWTTG